MSKEGAGRGLPKGVFKLLYLFPALRKEFGFNARGAYVLREGDAPCQDHLSLERHTHTQGTDENTLVGKL